MQSLLDKIAAKLGYAPQQELDEAQRQLRSLETSLRSKEKLLKELKDVKTEAIVKAIRETQMATVQLDEGWYQSTLAPSKKMSEAVQVKQRDPVSPKLYRVAAEIDVAQLQRIYDDLFWRDGRSAELDFFLNSFLHEVRRQIEVLMKVDM